ncbi:MAG: ImmA/IrrE family metallo-endopeptidase [Peptococcaceae bacterium]|nr:ImmA/IrrE family metallo-endopeptidase [Peptococcaceae bacterium]
MERIQTINASRIDWCCNDYGITREALAKKINISFTTLNKVMAGEDGLTFSQLRKMADLFGRGTLFFLEPGQVNEMKIHTPQFRTLSNQKPEITPQLKKMIRSVEQQREVFIELRDELDHEEITRFAPPLLNGLGISEAARVVRAWLRLTDCNDFSSYRQAIEAHGILVFRSNGYNGQWQISKGNPIIGFSLYDPICPVIMVKKQDSDSRQTFTLIHELGHLLLHQISSIDDEGDMHSSEAYEQEANAFTGHLLVPDIFLLSIDDRKRPAMVSEFDNWLEQQRKTWGVSGEAILRRLMDVGRLNSSEYNAYRQWKQEQFSLEMGTGGTRQYRCREPKHIFGDVFVRTVLDALSSHRITLTKASRYLDNLTIKDLHKLEQYYAGI